jgi:hypothetical protein
MKALPALGFTLKHDTVSSFVKGLAAYCEQNNIGPLVIENNVGLQVKVWTGDDVYSPYQTDVNGNFQSTESKLRALAKGKPFGRTHYPAANTPFDRLAVGKFLSFDAQMTSLIMEALDDESSPHFPAGLRTTTRNAMHASTQAAGHSVKDQEQARSAHALLCKALQLTSRYAPEVAENVLGRLREMTIQEGSGQLAVFVETFRKHAAEHEALSDAATDFGPLLARAVARSEVTSPALCFLQVKVGEMSEERAPLQDILAEMTKTAHRMTLLEVSRAGQDRSQPHALSLHIGSAPAARLCFDYLDGKCGRKNCDFEHREPCRNHAKGRCKRGSSCSYGHDPRIKSDVSHKGEKLDDDHKPRPLGHDPRVKSDALKRKLGGASKLVCHKCGRAGHLQRACPQGTKAEGAAAKVFATTVNPGAEGDFSQRLQVLEDLLKGNIVMPMRTHTSTADSTFMDTASSQHFAPRDRLSNIRAASRVVRVAGGRSKLVSKEGSWSLGTEHGHLSLNALCSDETDSAVSWTCLAQAAPELTMFLDNKGGTVTGERGVVFKLSRIPGGLLAIDGHMTPDSREDRRDATDFRPLQDLTGDDDVRVFLNRASAAPGSLRDLTEGLALPEHLPELMSDSEDEISEESEPSESEGDEPPGLLPADLTPEALREQDAGDLFCRSEAAACPTPQALATQQNNDTSWVAFDTAASRHLLVDKDRLVGPTREVNIFIRPYGSSLMPISQEGTMVVRSVARLLCTGALLAETGVNILAWAPLADKHCVAFLGHGAGAVYTEGGRLMLTMRHCRQTNIMLVDEDGRRPLHDFPLLRADGDGLAQTARLTKAGLHLTTNFEREQALLLATTVTVERYPDDMLIRGQLVDVKDAKDEKEPGRRTVNEAALQQAHQRLGHISRKSILALARSGGMEHFSMEVLTKAPTIRVGCDACLMGGMRRGPLNPPGPSGRDVLLAGRSPRQLPQAGARVGVDIFGPVPVPASDGARFLIAFNDVASGAVMVRRLVHTTSQDTAGALASVSSLFRLHGRPILSVRLDNASTWEKDFRSLCQQLGIVREFTQGPENQQQNGGTERELGVVTTMARKSLYAAGVGPTLFLSACEHAAQALRKTLPPQGGQATRLELCFGLRPDFLDSHPFCSLVIVRTKRTSKQTPNMAAHALFLGLSSNGVKALLLEQKREVVTRFGDCRFYDHVYPCNMDPQAPLRTAAARLSQDPSSWRMEDFVFPPAAAGVQLQPSTQAPQEGQGLQALWASSRVAGRFLLPTPNAVDKAGACYFESRELLLAHEGKYALSKRELQQRGLRRRLAAVAYARTLGPNHELSPGVTLRALLPAGETFPDFLTRMENPSTYAESPIPEVDSLRHGAALLYLLSDDAKGVIAASFHPAGPLSPAVATQILVYWGYKKHYEPVLDDSRQHDPAADNLSDAPNGRPPIPPGLPETWTFPDPPVGTAFATTPRPLVANDNILHWFDSPAGWFKGHIGARPTTAKERNSGFRHNVVFGPKETRASQLNPEDHGRLWFQIIKQENEEQVNAAMLDGMRRYNLFRGDDPPGPFAYVLAAPASLRVALQGAEREQWRAALLQEFEALDESLTWRQLHKSLTPKEAVLLPSMVVLTKKRKKDELGVEQDIFKARIVAAGNRERDDGQDTFSPTVAITALPLFLNIVAIYKMKDRQVDCRKAYTKAPIEKDGIFMRPPAGTPAADDGMVLQLLKNIYGRRIAGRNWFLEVQAFLVSLGFSSLELEPCWFYLKTELLFIMLILYVDDILYAYISEDETRATALLESIMQKYEGRIIQDSCFIGIQYVQLKDGSFVLHQGAYIASVLERVGMDKANPSKTLGEHGQELQKFDSPQEGVDLAEFQKSLGELRWMAHTNFHLGPQLSMIGRVQNFPGPDGVAAIKHLHRFLAGPVRGIRTAPTARRPLPNTYGFGIVLELEVHADASFLPQFRQTGRSIVGSLVLVGGVAVKATSNLTSKTLLSTHETEVAAANLGRVEGDEVSAMLRELGVLREGPYKLFCDNESVCTVATAVLLKTSKSRMIWGQHHRLREEVAEGTLVVQSIPSGENLADFLTKVLRAPEQERQTRRVLVNVEEVIAQVGVMPLLRR